MPAVAQPKVDRRRGLRVVFPSVIGRPTVTLESDTWEVVDLSPTSPEGQAAKRALDSLKGAHPNLNAGSASAPGTD